MTTAQVLSNAIANQLYRRRRPPREFVPPEGLRELPDRSSFPSGYTAAAIAFAGAVAPVRPTAGAACGLSASMVSAERVRNGAPYPFGGGRRSDRSGQRPSWYGPHPICRDGEGSDGR